MPRRADSSVATASGVVNKVGRQVEPVDIIQPGVTLSAVLLTGTEAPVLSMPL